MTTTPATTGALAAELRVAISRAARRIKNERGDAGLSDPQFNVVALLDLHGPMTPGQLAEAEHIAAPAMTRTVGLLADLGLVAKADHPTDGRQVVVTLTPAGEAEVRQTRLRRDVWLAGRLDGLTPQERAVLEDAAQLLRRIATS
ncbi:MarR family winged helix-turn-helix transcriptional regulator [Cellulomonas endophytica]|uniref:MarR family winged helix-turn-helix transcriptional regulator n=1 Tax=Cellulomonas endophytica TaxID=2494735 RepID=UPI001010DC3B|nr:MarR family transcriptional regulator [Cellulomonas endophytica]